MNKAVTEGLNLMPPEFVDGLGVWSSEDGTPGTTTYLTNPAGSLVASDPDFGDCLEVVTAESPQRIRYMGETPILPGCYLEVTARVKLISGPFPQARIAGYPLSALGSYVSGLDETGPPITLSDYGRVYTLRAIIGSGERTGVDLPWGTGPVVGHLGLDIVGSSGSVVRVESIQVEDRTDVFHRKLMDWVDVLDYGAIGDGIADDATAFENADAAAAGRTVIVPEGTYFLDRDVTMLSPVRFTGTVIQPANRSLVLRSNFDFPSYEQAFGDETTALKKGLQALFAYTDHESFDLKGRRVDLVEPLDVADIAQGIPIMRNRRMLYNGHLRAEDTPAWDPDIVTDTATYSSSDPLKLKNVTNVASIAIGSLVEGFGVGREVYVNDRNVAANELTLSQPLNRAAASQSYTFTRFKYFLDFSGFERVNRFTLDSIQFDGESRAAGVLLPRFGIWWVIRDCNFYQTGLRGITSCGDGCQGITIEQCEFQATGSSLPIGDREAIAFNTNKNDPKIRNCRAIDFKHVGIMSGNGNLLVGNHFWQLDDFNPGDRTAGLIIADRQSKTTITGNYIDNHFLEFTNEHTANAANTSGQSFGRVTIIGNIFTATQVADWFKFIVWAPIGTNHKFDGVTINDNTFQLFGGAKIDRVEAIDDSLGTFDLSLTRDLFFNGNSYSEVRERTQSPALVEFTQPGASTTWVVTAAEQLPFGGQALGVDSIVPHTPITSSGGGALVYTIPWVNPAQGAGGQSVTLNWQTAVQGTVQMRIRVDSPT